MTTRGKLSGKAFASASAIPVLMSMVLNTPPAPVIRMMIPAGPRACVLSSRSLSRLTPRDTTRKRSAAPVPMSNAIMKNSYTQTPDENGHFGEYGGRYVAETLMPLILEVEKYWNDAKKDPTFWNEFYALAKDYIGRPSPLYFASETTKDLGGAKVYFYPYVLQGEPDQYSD